MKRARPSGPFEGRAANTVRITQRGSIQSYVSYAKKILEASPAAALVLTGADAAAYKAITAAEVLKRELPTLYQITELGKSIKSLEAPAAPLVSCLTITLSLSDLDHAHQGYQPAGPIVAPKLPAPRPARGSAQSQKASSSTTPSASAAASSAPKAATAAPKASSVAVLAPAKPAVAPSGPSGGFTYNTTKLSKSAKKRKKKE